MFWLTHGCCRYSLVASIKATLRARHGGCHNWPVIERGVARAARRCKNVAQRRGTGQSERNVDPSLLLLSISPSPFLECERTQQHFVST